jgi:hypothetical protein
MNHNTRTVLQLFNEDNNTSHLRTVLLQRHGKNPNAPQFLRQNFESMLRNFTARIAREMSDSDPMPGVTPRDQTRMLNIEFLESADEFISARLVPESAPRYQVGDGVATSRYGADYQMAPADAKLNAWHSNPGSSITLREDSHADSGSSTYYGGGVRTGVDFCDQSHMNTSNHVEQFQTMYMRALNTDPEPHTSTVFGVATDASDARLLSRRIFKNNDRGQEGGIRAHERRLHNRHVDRDVTETLQGREREAQTYGYNMQPIYDRIAYKNNAKVQPGGSNDQPQPPRVFTYA